MDMRKCIFPTKKKESDLFRLYLPSGLDDFCGGIPPLPLAVELL